MKEKGELGLENVGLKVRLPTCPTYLLCYSTNKFPVLRCLCLIYMINLSRTGDKKRPVSHLSKKKAYFQSLPSLKLKRAWKHGVCLTIKHGTCRKRDGLWSPCD